MPEAMTATRLNNVLQRFEQEGICTRDDARRWVRFFSSIRNVLADERSQINMDDPDLSNLVGVWRRAPMANKVAVVSALDVWLLRVRLEWRIDEN
jgi:hypothetical protein